MRFKKNISGNLSLTCGILGLLILIFLIFTSITGINLSPNFQRLIIISTFFIGIVAIQLARLQKKEKDSKIAKTGFILGLIISIIDFPFFIISLFSG